MYISHFEHFLLSDRTSRVFKLAAGAIGLAALVACGGSGGSADVGQSSLVITGKVVDGPLQGVRVFVDLNNDFQHDAGEPISDESRSDGSFAVDVSGVNGTLLSTSQLVAWVTETAKDADDGGKTLAEAGRPGFFLASPLSAFVEAGSAGNASVKAPAFVSPLTTLVASEMALNGLTLAQARAAVGQTLGLGEKDPLSDFVTQPDADMGSLARELAQQLGEIGQAVSAIAESQGGSAVKEQIRDIVDALRTAPPGRSIAQSRKIDQPGLETVEDNTQIVSSVQPRAARPTVAASSTPRGFTDYVVVFKPTVAQPAAAAATAVSGFGGQIRFTYESAIKGFAVRLPASAAEAFKAAMERNPNVDRVEADIMMRSVQTVQNSATWGLDRVDQRALPLSGTYSYLSTGSGVRAYVVDTGILSSHTEFGGRVAAGYTAISDGRGTTDCNGHGTHVAGTIGASTWGIAKATTLVPVRVLACDGSGSLSGVIAGIDWVSKNGQKPAVVNMSLGGGASSSLDTAVANTVAAGFSVVVAAGNSSADACNYSPAREPSAITVGATANNDYRSSFSNYGSCLDVFAPGSSIKSTWYTSTTATATLNGTSMAAPHVAGLSALLLQASPTASPSTIANSIGSYSTTGVVMDAGVNSPNRLLYTLASTDNGGGTEPTTTVVGVGGLTGSKTTVRNGWRATVSVLVTNSSGAAVSGAYVSGAFTVGGSSVACTTGSNGTCSVSTGNLSNKTTSTTYTVKNITGTGLSSNGVTASLTVTKP